MRPLALSFEEENVSNAFNHFRSVVEVDLPGKELEMLAQLLLG